MPVPVDWEASLARFSPATSELLAARELKRRADTKFLMPPARAAELLLDLVADYAVLPAGTARVASYRTLYFDTPHLDFFHAHRRGRRARRKVRIRHYPDRLLSSLEIKSRRSELETSKICVGRPYGDSDLSADDETFVGIYTGCGHRLRPQVWTNFQRITLLGLRTKERVTVDLGLAIETERNRQSLDTIAIVEVKQWPFCRSTAVMSALRAGGWRPGSLSKYCTAIALSRPDLRLNRLLPALREIQRRVA